MAIVVDASVALAWVLEDTEARHLYSAAVAEAGFTGRELLIAPTILPAECSYTLLKRGRRARWPGVKTAEYAEVIGLFDIELRPIEPSIAAQVRFALRHNAQGYDALYLALAMETGAKLATLDNAMRSVARAAGVLLFEA